MTRKSSKIRSRECICRHEKQCRGMSLAFQMYEDARGGHVEVPQAAAPEFEFLHRMNELRKAYFRHLNAAKVDDTSAANEYVALHHFHPKVVRTLADAAGGRLSQVPHTFRLEDTRRLGWEPTEADRVYDIHGQRTEDFYFVPNYPIEFAYRDLKHLAKAERCTQDISTDVYQKAKLAIQARKEQERNDSKQKKNLDKQQKREKREDGDTKASLDRKDPAKRKEPRSTAALPTIDTTKCTPSIEETKDEPAENLLIGTFDVINRDNEREIAQSSSKVEQTKSKDAAGTEVSETLERSFSLFGSLREAKRPSVSSTQDDLGASDATITRYKYPSVSRDDPEASNATVGRTTTSLNSSLVSIQITEAAVMQGSSSNFHASDLTVPASNVAKSSVSIEQPLNAADEFPLDETPLRSNAIALPSCETKAEYSMRKSSKASAGLAGKRIETILESPDSFRITKEAPKAQEGLSSLRFADSTDGKSEKKMDCSPATPRRMVSERELSGDADAKEDENEKNKVIQADSPTRKQISLAVGEEEEEKPTEDTSGRPFVRRGCAASLSLLEKRKKMFRTTSEDRERNFSVTRSSSGHSGYPRKRKSEPLRARSFSGAGVRRSSDTSLFTAAVASRLSTVKRIDSTFRSLQQFNHSKDQAVDKSDLAPNNPRRAFAKSRRARSDSPAVEARQGRRLAIVESDGNELFKNRMRRNARSPRRTQSGDALPEKSLKRSSDPSPSRSQSPTRSLRRTRSEVPSGRVSRRDRIKQGKQGSQSSLSPKRSATGLKRTLSPKIKRIDTSKRAMQQFIQDANASADLTTDLSAREQLKRTCSKIQGLSPSTDLSPVPPVRSMLPFRHSNTRNLDSSLSDLDHSAPANLGGIGDRLKGSASNLMSGSSREIGRLHSSLNDLNLGPTIPTKSSDERGGASSGSDHSMPSDFASQSTGGNESPLLQSTRELPTMAESEEDQAKEKAVEPSPSWETHQDTRVDTVLETDKKSTPDKAPTLEEDCSQEQKNLDLEGEVDWESIGFASATSGSLQAEDKEEGSSTFALPLRLVGKRARQQLMAEVVILANQRQRMSMNRPRTADKMALAAASAVLSTVPEEEPIESQRRRSLVHQQRPSGSGCLDESSMSLSLGRVFRDNESSDREANETSDSSYCFQGSGCMSSEQLRTVFPFKAIQNKRKSGGKFHSPHVVQKETSNKHESPNEPEEGRQDMEDDNSEGSSDIESFVGCEANEENEPNEEDSLTYPSAGMLSVGGYSTDSSSAGSSLPGSPLPELVPMTRDCLDGEFHRGMRSREPAPQNSSDTDNSSSSTPTSGSEIMSSCCNDSSSFELAVPVFAAEVEKNRGTRGSSSQESSRDHSVEDPIREFNLSFPPSMAMATRPLPPTHACLVKGNIPTGVDQQQGATNRMIGGDELDKKIEVSFSKVDLLPRDIYLAGGLKNGKLEREDGTPKQKREAAGSITSSKLSEPSRPPTIINLFA